MSCVCAAAPSTTFNGTRKTLSKRPAFAINNGRIFQAIILAWTTGQHEHSVEQGVELLELTQERQPDSRFHQAAPEFEHEL